MDYSTRTINDNNIFSDSHYLNLKLSSPPPSSLSFDHNGDKAELLSSKTSIKSATPNSLSPVRGGSIRNEHAITLAEEIKLEKQTVAKFEIFKSVLGKLGGKDRIAKVLQYVLNLLKYYLTSTRRFVINEKFDNLSLDPRLILKTGPIKYLKLLMFLNSTMWEKKIFEVTKNISIFRQTLRFGGTPYRIRSFLSKINKFVKLPNFTNFQTIWFNEESLGDFIDLYYGICDEIILLYKLNVFTNQNFKSFVSKHEAYSWYLDIMLGLKRNYVKLQENRNKQLQLNIQYQVKQKASLLSKRLIENIGNSPIKSQILREFNNKSPINQSSLDLEISSLKHEEKIIMTDLIRLSFDFVCDSIDIFDLKLNPAVYLVCGAISGTFGLSKVWIMSKKELEDGQ